MSCFESCHIANLVKKNSIFLFTAFCGSYLEGVVSQVLVAVAVHDGVEDGAGHPDQVAADVDGDHRLAVHALHKSNS